MSFSWTTVTNVKAYIQPTKLFMFDIVVKERSDRLLRTIVVQTPSCEYLFSLANYVFSIHEMYPERHGNTPLALRIQQLYRPQFNARRNVNQPYALLNCVKKSLSKCTLARVCPEQLRKTSKVREHVI